MEKYYGNYLGIVVNSSDPENRNRLQVWIPNLTNTLYTDWNTDLTNKTLEYNGLNDSNPVFIRLKNSLPWAECASPLIGGGTAMNINPAVQNTENGSTVDVPVEDQFSVVPDGLEGSILDGGSNSGGGDEEPIRTDENGVVQIFPEESPTEGSNQSKNELGPDGKTMEAELPYFPDDPNGSTAVTSVPTDIDAKGNHTAKKEVNSTVERKPIPIVSPVNGILAGGPASTYTAMRNSGTRKHSGIDWQAKNGSVVKEMVGGTVLYNGNNSGYGANIVIKGDDNVIRRYATHGTTVNATVGSRIDQGQDVGTIAQGHLHYEEIPENLNGNRNSVYDEFISRPGQFVNTSNQRGTIDPLSSNNFSKGTLVQAGSPIGEGIIANVSPQDANQSTGESNPVISDPMISAVPAQGNPSPAGAAKGVVSSPTEGARVWVFFYGGDIQKPVYFASAISEYGQAYQA